jgi:hypothetical protein
MIARGAESERVVFVTSRVPRPTTRMASSHDAPLGSPNAPVPLTLSPRSTSPRSDTSSARPNTPEPELPAKRDVSQSARSSIEMAPGLLRPGPSALPWFTTPKWRALSAPAAPPSASERDSTLGDLHDAVPDLAARRVTTSSERDSAAKAALLKMHNTGRTLLVPPDNTGGLISASIPFSLLGAVPSRARRARGERSLDEARARLERLLARADSMRRATEDSARSEH